jgi:protein SCO1/2
MKNLKNILPLFVLLLIISYAVYQWLRPTVGASLPYYAVKADKSGYFNILTKDNAIQVNQDFCATNQEGKQICNNTELKGKVYAVIFFFTTCEGICKDMTRQLQRVYKLYESKPDFKLLSITSDPETDTVAQLMAYAKLQGVTNHQAWNFLTADREKLYDLAKNQFFLLNPDDKDPTQFIHTERGALIDSEGYIRGFYDVTDEREVNKLINHIRLLLKE